MAQFQRYVLEIGVSHRGWINLKKYLNKIVSKINFLQTFTAGKVRYFLNVIMLSIKDLKPSKLSK